MELKPNLPRKIIENILSRIPVKYLFRFKSVCKQWNSTISDPRFGEIHVKQFKHRRQLAWEVAHDFDGFYIAELQKNRFQFVSVIEYPWEEHDFPIWSGSIVCYCDGLYLRRYRDGENKHSDYVLWNPSTRTYRRLSCPYLVDDDGIVLHGMCYDPLMKDYKIVIGDMKHYAVFMCRNNKWGEVKEMEECFSKVNVLFFMSRISFNGSYYWIMFTEIEYMKVEFEIIIFDFGDEKFKKTHKPNFEVEYDDVLDLASIGGHLCLLVRKYDQMRIMKKVEDEDSWIEFKVLDHLLEYCSTCVSCSICSINEDEILLQVNSVYDDLLYDQRNDTFVKIPRNPHRDLNLNPVPYVENILLL